MLYPVAVLWQFLWRFVLFMQLTFVFGWLSCLTVVHNIGVVRLHWRVAWPAVCVCVCLSIQDMLTCLDDNGLPKVYYIKPLLQLHF